MEGAMLAGSLYVEISLDTDQFNRDFKIAQLQVTDAQRRLQADMLRNKAKFELDTSGIDTSKASGAMLLLERRTQYLNEAIGTQQKRVKIAAAAWEGIALSKGVATRAAITAESALYREQMQLAALIREQTAAKTSATGSGTSLLAVGVGIVAAATAVYAGYKAVKEAAVGWGQAVKDIGEETGMATEDAARMAGSMYIVGISTEDAQAGLAKFAKTVATAAKEQDAAAKAGQDAGDVFSKWGIDIRDTSNNLLSYEQILGKVQATHRLMDNGLQKTSFEMEMFGKSGYKWREWLNLSNKEMEDYGKKIGDFGLALQDAQKFEDYARSVNVLSLAIKGLAVEFIDTLPSLEQFLAAIKEVREWIIKYKDIRDDLKNSTPGEIFTGGMIFKVGDTGIGGTNGVPEVMQQAIEAARLQKQAQKERRVAAEEEKKAQEVEVRGVDEWAKKIKLSLDTAKRATEEQKKARDDLNIAKVKVTDGSGAARVLEIDKERKAWALKTNDEVAATRWAEAEKDKLSQDSIQKYEAVQRQKAQLTRQYADQQRNVVRSALLGEFGDVINAVQQAILEGKSQTTAYNDAMKKYEKNKDAERRAIAMVGAKVGLSDNEVELAQRKDWEAIMSDMRATLKEMSAEYAAAMRALNVTLRELMAAIMALANSANSSGGNNGNNSNGNNSSGNKTNGNSGLNYQDNRTWIPNILPGHAAGEIPMPNYNITINTSVEGRTAQSDNELAEQIATHIHGKIVSDMQGGYKYAY